MTGTDTDRATAFTELERAVQATLEIYANIHRGSGPFSLASTALFERARAIVLEHFRLDRAAYVTVFCSPYRAEQFQALLPFGSYSMLASLDLGLPLGVRALAVAKKALPQGIPFQTGGGVVKLVNPKSVVWADAPDSFEAGTPAIINVIAFAKALQLCDRFGRDVFKIPDRTGFGKPVRSVLYDDELLRFSGQEVLRKLRPMLMGRDIRVPTADGERPYTNLDNAATTPTFAPIWETVCRAWRQPEPERQALMSEVKRICAEFVGAPPEEYEVIFTSNTTEALNLAAQCLSAECAEHDARTVIVNTLLEHHSNELPWRYCSGVACIRMPVDAEGFINVNDLERLLRAYNQDGRHGKQRIRLVAICGASNVLGTFNDLPVIGRIAHQYGARFLVDGAQLAAHRNINMAQDGIDCLAFSGHKLYAPFGSGALVTRKGLFTHDPAKLATMQASGEENVAGIAALGKAILLLQRIGFDVIQDEERALTRQALQGIANMPGIKVFGCTDPDSPRFQQKGSVIAFSVNQTPHNLAAKEFAELGGIGVRNGCFCAHLIVKHLLRISPLRAWVGEVLATFVPNSQPGDLLPGLVRISFGLENEAQDVDLMLRILERITRARRSLVKRCIAATHNGTPFPPRTSVQKQIQTFVDAAVQRIFSENCHT